MVLWEFETSLSVLIFFLGYERTLLHKSTNHQLCVVLKIGDKADAPTRIKLSSPGAHTVKVEN